MAATVDISSTADKNTLNPTDQAKFKLYIKNNGPPAEFEIVYFGTEWRVDFAPNVVEISNSDLARIDFIIAPVGRKNTGSYGIPIYVVYDGNKIQHTFVVNYVDYPDLVELDFDPKIPEIDPRKETTIRLKIINKHDMPVNNLDIKLKSEFFEENRKVDLAPHETKTESYVVEFPEDTGEGDYDLKAFVIFQDQSIFELNSSMKIGHYASVKGGESEEEGFLFNKFKIVKENEGNSIAYESVIYSFSGFERLFTRTDPKPSSVEKKDGLYEYRWNLEIEPNSSKEVVIITSYRTFVIVIVIIVIVLFLLYYYLKRDLALTKKIIRVKHEGEGISNINVSLTLRNNSILEFKNIKIMDRITSLAELPDKFGSLKPDKIIRTDRGTELIWDVPIIHGREERAFSYNIKTKAPLKDIIIPISVARYTKVKRKIIVRSNKIVGVFQ